MITLDIARRSMRNLNQSKIRTILTAGAIGIAAFALALTIALGASLNNIAEQLFFSGVSATAIQITARPPENSGFTGIINPDEIPEYTETSRQDLVVGQFLGNIKAAQIEELKKIEGVARVDLPYEQGVNAKYISAADIESAGCYHKFFIICGRNIFSIHPLPHKASQHELRPRFF